MVGCVLSQLNPRGSSFLAVEKALGLLPRTFSTARNVEILRLYPIHIAPTDKRRNFDLDGDI